MRSSSKQAQHSHQTTEDNKVLSQRLKEAGLRPTQQRLIIYRTLLHSHDHLNAEGVYAALQHDHPSLSMGTVYRVLDVLADANLVQRVAADKGSMRFEARLDTHHHLICHDTGEILDYHDPELNQLLEDYFRRKRLPGFKAERWQLNINGTRSAQQT